MATVLVGYPQQPDPEMRTLVQVAYLGGIAGKLEVKLKRRGSQ